MSDSKLNFRQLEFVRHYCANGGNATAAAKVAGYSPKNAAQTGRQLLLIPKVLAEIQKAKQELRERTKFTLDRAMEEADAALKFAETHKNPMAAFKARELKCRLAGLLDQRIELNLKSTVSVRHNLDAANARVMAILQSAPRDLEAIHQKHVGGSVDQADDEDLKSTIEDLV